MKIKCSECGSSYSLSEDRIQALEYSTFQCGICGKKIKIAVCPSCGKVYSVTYRCASSSRYSIGCSSCGEKFTETFAPDSSVPERISPVQPVSVQKKKNLPSCPEPSLKAGRSAGFLSFKRLAGVLKNSFRPSGLFFGAVGAAALSLCFFMRFLNSVSFKTDHYGWQWAAVTALLLTVYFFSAACIAAWAGSKMTLKTALRLTVCRFPFIAGGALSTAGIFFGALYLFTELPVMAPGIFGLVFFPVYMLVLAGAAAAYSGFWFYPAYAVDEGSSGKMILGFFRFIRDRFFRVLTVSLVLSVFTGAGAGVISLIHYGLKLLISRLGTIFDFPVLVDFSSCLSWGFRDAADFLYPLRITAYFSEFSSGVTFWTASALCVLSLACAAWLISWMVSLSCAAFDELKKGISGRHLLRMWIFLAASGCLCVLCIFMARAGFSL